MDAQEQEKIFTVGGLALALRKCADTIRELDRRGIIQSRRDSSNRRIYGAEQLQRALDHYARKSA